MCYGDAANSVYAQETKSRNQARGVACYHGGGMCYSHGVAGAVWVLHCCTAWSECGPGSRCYSCAVTRVSVLGGFKAVIREGGRQRVLHVLQL